MYIATERRSSVHFKKLSLRLSWPTVSVCHCATMSARNAARTTSSRLPAMSSALKALSRKEQDKLKGALSEQLRQDMKRLLDEGTFADLSLVVDSERILVHTQLLQTRLADFLSSVVQPQMTLKEGEQKVADLSALGVTVMDLNNLLRAVYTEDNVNPDWNAFQDAMKSHDSAELLDVTKNNTDQDGIADISKENQTGGLVTDQSQKPDSGQVHMELNGMDVGNQTAASGVLSMEVCEYAALENTEPTVGCGPSTTKQKTNKTGELEHPQADIKSSDQKQCKNSAISSRPKTRAKTFEKQLKPSSACSDQASKEAKTQGHSSNSSIPLPSAACHLGRDLLHIFTMDSGHDIIIKVDGKEIPAHRFMLCARSQYFSAMLEGSWRESSSSEIPLTGFSHAAVMLALQFIYGGVYELPDGIIIRDVLYLADMYGLDMFKDVVEFKLRKDYCHFFHKPCSICLARIPECLVLFSGIDLSDLDQCIFSWLVQYLDRAWGEKTFASLPQDILFRCREFAIQSFSPQSVVTLLLRVDKLVCSLPHVKWTQVVHSTALHLQDACMQYMATNFLYIIGERSFRSLLEGMNWKKELVEAVFSRVVPTLTSDTSNLTFVALYSLQLELADVCDHGKWNPDAVSMVQLLYSQCYSYMVNNANLMAQAKGWNRLPSDLRERIKEEGVFIDSRGKAPARKPVLTSSLKAKTKSVSGSSKGSLEINSK